MNMPSFSPIAPNPRTSAIVVTVLLLHVGGLWALQSGLLRRIVADLVVPAEVLIDLSPAEAEPAPPKPRPPVAPPAQAPRTPAPQPTPAKAPQAAPTPLAVPATPTEPDNSVLSPAPVAVASNASTNTSAVGASSASPTSHTTGAASRAPALELPSSDAQYLNNPTPTYPAWSKRLGEQGKVVIRTFIGVDGTAQQAQIKQSSGYDRLDQAALATALKWRYVPGKRAGVAEAMWFDVPFNWVLR
jgi:protein TonB